MSVRSARLAIGVADTTAVTVYTVPTGKRTIWKTTTLLNVNAGFGRIVFDIVHGATDLGLVSFALGAHGTVGESEVVSPWVVLEEGDSVIVQASVASIYWTMNGAELAL